MARSKRWQVKEPEMELTSVDVAWAAGFLEGDGYFGVNNTTPEVSVVQKDEWPVLRLQKLFGGSLGQIHKQGVNNSTYWRWRVSGDKARRVARLTYELLSPRRQEQARRILQ